MHIMNLVIIYTLANKILFIIKFFDCRQVRTYNGILLSQIHLWPS